jgi:multidrug efflux system membrane fusion protein
MRMMAVYPLGLLLTGVLLGGCTGKPAGTADTEAPVVSISQVIEREGSDYEDFTGRLEAVKSVDVKARATGYLTKVNFKEGDMVKAKDILYEIDDRTYKASLAQAEGAVAQYKATLDRYNADLARARRMVVGNAISREDYDKNVASKDETAAQLQSARAQEETAKLNLGFTKVYAEITGQISRTNITEGNLVTADQTLLTTIVSTDPIYVYFDVDERTVLRVEQLIRDKKMKSAREAKVPVFVGTQVEKGFPHEGYIDFVDNKLDANTGTLRVRGKIPNPGEPPILGPGMFVRVRVPIGEKRKALLVADQAVAADQGLKVVYVVNDKNVVEQRSVELGALRDGLRVVESGLKPGDWIVVKGLQRIQQGMTVEPKKVPMPAPPQT